MKHQGIRSVLVALLLTGIAWAGGYGVGDSITSLDLDDQFGTHHHIETMPKTMVLVFDRAPAALADEYFGKQPEGYLAVHRSVYVADISLIPSFVAESFAIPKMRTYCYPVLLMRDEELGLRFPAEEGKITVLHLDANGVRRIEYVDTAEGLKAAIER